jgi:rhodanese-related sulfurtransferase
MLMNERIDEVDVGGLRKALDGDAVLVDVREYAEFAGGRVAGARLVPLGDLDARARELDRDRPIYLICRTGRRSGEAQRRLRALGFDEVVNVCGGMMAWQDAGYPVERDAHAPWALERQVRFVAGLIVVTGVLLSVFVAQPFVWLAGFVGAGLVFAAVTDSCMMGMLLAKMPWNTRYEASAAAGTAVPGK